MRHAVRTSAGDVWLFGSDEAFSGVRPVLLAISGAFAPADAFDRLPTAAPEAAVLRAHLPGNHSPLLIDQTLSTCAAALSEAVRGLGRPTVVCGSSLGGTVALGLRAPNLRGVIALDPPLNSSSCGPLIGPFRQRLAQQPTNEALRSFLWEAFGLGSSEAVVRDHIGLVRAASVAATVIVGDALDPPSCHSLVGPDERRALAEMQRIRLVHSALGGHNLVVEDSRLVLAEVRRAFSCADA